MNTFVKFIMVVLTFYFLPLMPLQAAVVSPTPVRVDGTYPLKKRKVVRKKAVKPRPAISNPTVGMFISADQVILNSYFISLTFQEMRQVGDKIVAKQKDGTFGPLFDNPRDQQIAESLIKQFKTKDAVFISTPASSKAVSVNTIALNKDSWSDAEIAALRKFIENSFAPIAVNFAPATISSKSLVLPPSMVGINSPSH